jgi:hypothetical protein
MTTLHAQTLVEHARRARDDRITRNTQSSTRDLFCAGLVGYLRAYDIPPRGRTRPGARDA